MKKFAINSKNVKNIDVRMFAAKLENQVEMKAAYIFVFWHAIRNFLVDNTSVMISVILVLANLAKFILENHYFVRVA